MKNRPDAPRESLTHLPLLDSLRGIAILFVFYFHAAGSTNFPDFGAWNHILTVPSTGLWSGVDLFFVLSGYLITRILLNSKGASNYFKVFYARRFLRIFPVYYMFLIFILLLTPIGADSWLRGNQIWFWTYLQNWKIPGADSHNPSIDHLWSLGIEEQFYLFWPMCVALLDSRSLRRICLAIIVLCPLARLACSMDYGWKTLYMNSFFRLDTLMVGSLLAILEKQGQLKSYGKVFKGSFLLGIAVIATAYVLAGPNIIGSKFSTTIGLSGFSLVYSSILYFSLLKGNRHSLINGNRISAFLRLLGKHSYVFYLIHVPIIFFFVPYFFPPSGEVDTPGVFFLKRVIFFIVTFLCSLGLARLTWLLFENPILRLKRNFTYK
jgi:peptidoglycan/LPS O-acetylase OafA/YrhL